MESYVLPHWKRLRVAVLLPALSFVVMAGLLKPGHIGPQANPPEYRAFSHKLPAAQMERHALDRLTFGAKPGDLQALHRMGLDRWLDLQLHPERIRENPQLAEALRPLESIGMTAREAMLHYPPPNLIVAVARGTRQPPADPELNAVVSRLAERYLQRKGELQSVKVADLNDENLEPRTDLSAILPPDQVQVLESGKPDQKAAILDGIPRGKQLDFALALRPPQRRALFPIAPVELRRELMFSINPQGVVAQDVTESKLLRAVYSNRQFQELLVDFWFNHFNVNIEKGANHYSLPSYERDSIRPYVFGRFEDLLLATAKSPAMLFYLDNWQSVGPKSFQKSRPKTGLNENYGRELLELHTLGVDGGYTQKDVIEVARCFTGWTIAGPRKGGGFEYNDKVHDKGQKIVLGNVIPAGGGMDDGLRVIEILAHHPSTARFISFQLAKRFVADDPPPSLVNRMAETFRTKDGDLREVYLTMVRSPEFWSQGAYRAKVKSPFEMVASALRVTGADVSSAFAVCGELQRLGEPLYRKVEPTGYSSANAEWVSSAALIERINFALRLAKNQVPGVHVDTVQLRTSTPGAVSQSIFASPPSAQTGAAIASSNNGVLAAAIALGSPEFQRK